MRLFKASFPANWLGGVAIICAKDAAEAKEILEREAKEWGIGMGRYREELVEIEHKTGIIYFDDGDY